MGTYSLDEFLSMVFPSEAIKQHGFILVPVRDTDFFDLDEDKNLLLHNGVGLIY